MKKFLTVLLALSVVFTYTVGTAFALPSDTSTEAGLAAAKAEAIQELKDYPDMSEFTATGQAKVKAIIADYTDKINDATKVGNADGSDPDSVYGLLKAAKGEIDTVTEKETSLVDAKNEAKAQFADYLSLITPLVTNSDFVKSADKLGFGTFANIAAFKTAAEDAIDDAVDADGVKKVLNTYLERTDKVCAQLKAVELPQSDIDQLVKEIRAYADGKNVSSATHSASVVNAFEKAIAEGVAAAKAVTTWDEYYKVQDKYLGAAASKAEAKNGNVYVHIEQESVFDKFENKTKEVEKQIKAVEQLLSTIGEYNYKDVESTNWTAVEDFYAEAKYFVENGTFDKLTGSATGAQKALYDLVKGSTPVEAGDTASEVTAKVNAVVDEFNKLSRLAALQNQLVDALEVYPDPDLSAYSDVNKTRIEALQATGANLINAATTLSNAQKQYDAYIEKIDAVKTKAYEDFEATIANFDADLTAYIAENTPEDIAADAKVLLDRFVKDLRAEFIAAETAYDKAAKSVETYTLTGGSKALSDIVAGIDYDATALADIGYGVAAPAASDYNSRNAGIVDGIYNEYTNEKIGGAAPAVSKWAEFFPAYDKATAEIDAVQTKVQEDYLAAIDAVEKAMQKLGTPALTTEFKTALGKVTAAINGYKTAKTAFDALDADEKAEITKTLDKTAYDEANFEYEWLKHVDALGVAATSTVAEVEAFTEIAGNFLEGTINNLFSAAAKAEIAKIITDTYDAINAAKTDAAKAAAALKGIEALDAVAVDGSGAAANLAELLATVKAEAAKYFAKYENAAFTSDAATELDLVKDIIAFNEQFLKADEKAARIADVKAFKIKCTTKRYTGSKMRVNWTIVEGNESAIDGYRIYYSTKKSNSGYKYLAKTTKKYINHTSIKKNVKKGTRVFYRVRAYAEIDGVRYFSDYSTVGNRIWK